MGIDYKNIIKASVGKKRETVREAVARIENSDMYRTAQPLAPPNPQLQQQQAPAPTIEFVMDNEKDKLVVTKNNNVILELEGEEMWGQAISYFKKQKYRGNLPQDTKFVMNTKKKGPVDISWEFRQEKQAA